jgi:Zn-dependent protease
MPGSWWMADAWATSPAYLVSWIVLVVFSIVVHELAHGWTAIKCGDDVPLRSGHMTINPFVHIPPFAWIMFLLVGITWGLMPTNPSNYRRRYDDALVAFAGPASNLVLAVFFSLAAVLWGKYGTGVINQEFYQNMDNFLTLGTVLNAVLFLFNLIPVPPLDGSRILGNFVPAFDRLWQGERGQIIVIVVFVGVFLVAGRIVWGIGGLASALLIDFWSTFI